MKCIKYIFQTSCQLRFARSTSVRSNSTTTGLVFIRSHCKLFPDSGIRPDDGKRKAGGWCNEPRRPNELRCRRNGTRLGASHPVQVGPRTHRRRQSSSALIHLHIPPDSLWSREVVQQVPIPSFLLLLSFYYHCLCSCVESCEMPVLCSTISSKLNETWIFY